MNHIDNIYKTCGNVGKDPVFVTTKEFFESDPRLQCPWCRVRGLTAALDRSHCNPWNPECENCREEDDEANRIYMLTY